MSADVIARSYISALRFAIADARAARAANDNGQLQWALAMVRTGRAQLREQRRRAHLAKVEAAHPGTLAASAGLAAEIERAERAKGV